MSSTQNPSCERGWRILRLPDVKQLTGLGKTQIYEGISTGTFPRPVPISVRAVGWIESELERWVAQRIAARNIAETAQPVLKKRQTSGRGGARGMRPRGGPRTAA
jgi:prophage regulatory protein